MTLITRPSMKHWLSAQSWTVKCCKLLTCHANRFFSWSFKTVFKSVVLNNFVYLCRVPFKVVVCSKQRDTVLFFQWLLQSWKKKKNTKPLTTVLCVRWSGLCRDTVSYHFQCIKYSAQSTGYIFWNPLIRARSTIVPGLPFHIHIGCLFMDFHTWRWWRWLHGCQMSYSSSSLWGHWKLFKWKP